MLIILYAEADRVEPREKPCPYTIRIFRTMPSLLYGNGCSLENTSTCGTYDALCIAEHRREKLYS